VLDGVTDAHAIHGKGLGFVPAELACRLLYTTHSDTPACVAIPKVELGGLHEDDAEALFDAARGRPSAEVALDVRRLCRALELDPLAVSIGGHWLGRDPKRRHRRLTAELERGGKGIAAVRSAVIRLGWEEAAAGEGRRVLELIAIFGERARMPAERLALLAGTSVERARAEIAELVAHGLADADDDAGARLFPDVQAYVAAQLEDRAALEREALASLERALGDVGRLENEVARRGVSAVLADARMLADAGTTSVADATRVLTLEASALVGWKAARAPAFGLQQLRARAHTLDLQALVDALTTLLAARGVPWIRVRYRTIRSGEATSRVLEGHSAKVNAVAITPDARLALSASDDRTVRVWDLATGETRSILGGHVAGVLGVAVSKDGKIAASCAKDNTVIVWDVARARPVHHLRGHADVVHAVALSDEAGVLASASEDRTIRLWDLATGEHVGTLQGHHAGVLGVSLSADGGLCVSASWDDNALVVWSVEQRRVVRRLEAPRTPIASAAIQPSGGTLVVASVDDDVLRWTPFEEAAPDRLEGHEDSVADVAMTADGRVAISGSWDHTVRVWDLEARRALGVLHGHRNAIWGVATTPDGRVAVSGSEDRTVRVWDLAGEAWARTGGPLPRTEGHGDRICALAATRDGSLVVSASFDDTVRIWDARSGAARAVLEGHALWVYGVALVEDGKRAVSASLDGSIRVWDVETAKLAWAHANLVDRGPFPIVTLSDGTPLCPPLILDERRMTVITSTASSDLGAWELERGRPMCVYAMQGAAPLCGAVVGDVLLVGRTDGRVALFDLGTGEPKGELVGHKGAVRALAVSPDGTRLLTGSEDRTLRLWDLGAGQLLRVFSGHAAPVGAVVFMRDGRHVASASSDRSLLVWNLGTGAEAAELVTSDPVDALCVGPNPGSLVAGDHGGNIHFLELDGVQ